jgi:hypothetical protein
MGAVSNAGDIAIIAAVIAQYFPQVGFIIIFNHTPKFDWDLITHVTQKPKKVSETAIPSEIAAKP